MLYSVDAEVQFVDRNVVIARADICMYLPERNYYVSAAFLEKYIV
jgi:hypothetical protein